MAVEDDGGCSSLSKAGTAAAGAFRRNRAPATRLIAEHAGPAAPALKMGSACVQADHSRHYEIVNSVEQGTGQCRSLDVRDHWGEGRCDAHVIRACFQLSGRGRSSSSTITP